jgi:mannose-1-phosphate guanylyltransferase
VAVVRTNIPADDIRPWDPVPPTHPPDAGGKLAHGPAYAVDSDGTIAWTDDRPIVLFGVRDLIVVNSGALTLVMPRERAADLKKLLAELPPELRDLA